MPIKGLLHCCSNVFLSLAFFWCFLRISISPPTLSICSYMLSTLSSRGLSILITVVLNSWSDNSKIPAMSGSNVCSVSLSCVFLPFGTSCNFFLIARRDVFGCFSGFFSPPWGGTGWLRAGWSWVFPFPWSLRLWKYPSRSGSDNYFPRRVQASL